MRPLSRHFAPDALSTVATCIKQTKTARVFRRAPAVRAVVAGPTVPAVSATFQCTNSALRKGVQRFAREGTQGLLARPRRGRPPQLPREIATQLNLLVDQDPLAQGVLHAPGNGRELASVLSPQSGIALGRERVRLALKKTR